jgi:tRNA A-37 threonylcarbamoyl transferase component Bud32
MVDIRCFRKGSWTGEIAASCFVHLGALLESFDRVNSGEILKEGKGRMIWVVPSPLGPLCVKEFHNYRLRDRICAFFRGTRAHSEWLNHTRLADRGVPVPTPILWAEQSGGSAGRRGILVSQYISPCFPLSDLFDGRVVLTPGGKRCVLEEMGKTLALLHRAGGRHDDPHGGNVLVENSPGSVRVWLTDLQEVALKKRLSWKERLKNLGGFLGGHATRLSVVDKQRCLRAYLQILDDWVPAFRHEQEARRSMAKAVEFYAARDYRKRWHSRIAKCQEDGRRFHAFRAGAYTGWVRASWDHPRLRQACMDPNALIASEAAFVVKDTPTTTVASLQLDGLEGPLFIKRYNRKSIWERTKNLFRRSRAIRVWRSAYALEMLGIQTPESICVLERRVGPLLLESFMMTRWIDQGMGLDEFYRLRFGGAMLSPSQRREKRLLEREVAGLFRSLHQNRISHGDLKGRNVILDPNQPAPFNPQFVDLDAMSIRPLRFRRSRINDLSRLLFSLFPTASLLAQVRFFREYARGNPSLWLERRVWWRAIQKRTDRKLQEKHLSLRP